MKFKFRYADKIVGFFTLVALLLLVTMVVFAGVSKKWFTKKVEFNSLFTSADGLKVGMSINLRGFEIGRLKDFNLNDDNQVDVVFYIYDTYHDRIRPDSVVALPSSLLGSGSAIELYPGLSEDPPLPDGAFIPSTQTVDGKMLVKTRRVDRSEGGDGIGAILSDLPGILDNLDSAILSIDDLASTLTRGLEGRGNDSLSSTLRNVEGLTAGLERSMLDVNKVTSSLAVLSGQLESPQGLVPTLFDPKGSIATFLDDNDVLWNQILSILNELDGAVGGIHMLSTSLAGLSPQLSLTLDELIRSLEEAQKVMEGLKNNPLLRKGISEERPPQSVGTDLRVEDF